jgi:hypothetical protein
MLIIAVGRVLSDHRGRSVARRHSASQYSATGYRPMAPLDAADSWPRLVFAEARLQLAPVPARNGLTSSISLGAASEHAACH